MTPNNSPNLDPPSVELRDSQGRLIGEILRPVGPEVLGPGRETVYLNRHRAA